MSNTIERLKAAKAKLRAANRILDASDAKEKQAFTQVSSSVSRLRNVVSEVQPVLDGLLGKRQSRVCADGTWTWENGAKSAYIEFITTQASA